jgi:hypothetical protein
MRNHLFELKQNLDSVLNQIDFETSDIIQKAKRSITAIENCLRVLKKIISRHKFTDPQDEIIFFKEIKPTVYGKLIYFFKIVQIESRRPIGSDKCQIAYYHKELNKIEDFYNDNIDFYSYIRNNSTDLDDKYFIRGKLNPRMYTDLCFCDEARDFSTSHDHTLAQVLAYDMLAIFLNDQIAKIERNESDMSRNNKIRNNLQWTDSKTSLVELIYAIKYSGCINNGAITVIELKSLFESLLAIDLTDSYKAYSNIKGRQRPAKFIEKLKTALTNKVMEDFE